MEVRLFETKNGLELRFMNRGQRHGVVVRAAFNRAVKESAIYFFIMAQTRYSNA